MKMSFRILADLLVAGFLLATTFFASCNKIPAANQQGSLQWSFAAAPTRALLALPDTDAFLLDVRDAQGKILYQGSYGASPESLLVSPGNYSVRVASRDFTVPEFDAPQFGDEEVVAVAAGAAARVVLNCTQLNAGIRLHFLPEFQRKYPAASFSIASADGSLAYSYQERRTAFFKPGSVSVSLQENGSSTPLMTRTLAPCEILSVGISCAEGTPATPVKELMIVVDTARYWNSEDFVLGGPDAGAPGSSPETALSIAQAKGHIGGKDVWVSGFIVGGDLSSTKNGVSFSVPFTSRTNMAIAARSSAAEKASCLSVQLAKGKFRDELNLVDHPEMLGRKVCLKGKIVGSYYGIPGIQDLSEYSFK